MIYKDLNALTVELERLRLQGRKVVWTNWCFDIIHPWHLETFKQAKQMWDILVVWLNWDKSPYFQTKPWRPINDENFRSLMLDGFKYIDYVYIFDDETPILPISTILPDILVKWWDYKVEDIVWYNEVTQNWWKVITIPVVWNYSTSNVIKKILEVYK